MDTARVILFAQGDYSVPSSYLFLYARQIGSPQGEIYVHMYHTAMALLPWGFGGGIWLEGGTLSTQMFGEKMGHVTRG